MPQTIVVYYCIFGLMFFVLVDNKKNSSKVLNHLRPTSFSHLYDLAQNKVKVNPEILHSYIEYYNEIVKFMPHRPAPYGMLGYCYYQLGDLQKAIKKYKKAIEENPYFFGYYYNLGALNYQMGQYKPAIESLKNALNTKPKNNMKFIMSSIIYKNTFTKQGYVSQEEFRNKLREGQKNSYILVSLSYYRLGLYSSMRQIAKASIDLGFDDQGEFLFLMGLSLHHSGKYEEAVYYYQEYIKKNPNNTKVFLYLSKSLKELNRHMLSKKALNMFINGRNKMSLIEELENEVALWVL